MSFKKGLSVCTTDGNSGVVIQVDDQRKLVEIKLTHCVTRGNSIGDTVVYKEFYVRKK